MSAERADFLPEPRVLQAVAAAVLTARNKRVWSILGCYAVLLFFTRVYVVPSGSSIGITVEVIAVNGFPLHCLLVGAAVMPGQPPREAQNIVISVYILAAAGAFRVALGRLDEFQHASALEQWVRVLVPSSFCVCFVALCVLAGTNRAKYWMALRAGIVMINVFRIICIFILYVFVEPRPIIYPPRLPFGPALANSALGLAIAAGATPHVRACIGRWTGATNVALRLHDITPRGTTSSGAADGPSGTVPRTRRPPTSDSLSVSGLSSRSGGHASQHEYVKQLERTVEALTADNRRKREELSEYYASIGMQMDPPPDPASAERQITARAR